MTPSKSKTETNRCCLQDTIVIGAVASVAFAILTPAPALAFGGIPSSGACTNFVNNPQDFARHRQGVITYRLTNNFKTRYPDDFSQYLVSDVAELWSEYIGGVTPWNADIVNRFSYYRNDPGEAVYELKSVLAHEFGHIAGMQHSDACFYNNNPNTNMPYNLNFRTSGGVFNVQATIGPEIMNEVPTASSPGAKAAGPIDGYFRTPGRDALQFAGAAYPFQSVMFQEVNAGPSVFLVDSTDIASGGGQVMLQATTNISPNDPQQGRFIDQQNLWIGNNIGIKSRYESWNIENFTGFDITQITLRIDGTSTRRAIFETAPPFFTNFGASRQSSPEQMIFSWSTPPGGPWPPTASGWLGIRPDVHDWQLAEGLMWHFSNQAFPLALAYYNAETPWTFATPNTPAPQLAPQYTIDPSLPPEPTPIPDDIELLPPASSIAPGSIRGLTTHLPQGGNVNIESFELLAIDWAEAELLFRTPLAQRNERLVQLFASREKQVRNLLGGRPGVSPRGVRPEDAGFHEEKAASHTRIRDQRTQEPKQRLSRRDTIDLPERQTYAVRLVASNEHARVTSLSMPEHTTYLGAQIARCDAASTAAYCCPTEITSRVELGGTASMRRAAPYSTARLKEPSCIAGGASADVVIVNGKMPHFLTLGDGDDKVRVFQPGSVVLLGRGDDIFEAKQKAAANVRGGLGADIIHGSLLSDHIDAGGGDDQVKSDGGDDVVRLGAGDDHADAGPGADTIYPGSGRNYIDAGEGDDAVIFLHQCEFSAGASIVNGGIGNDRLVLPITAAEARHVGLQFEGFEEIIENASRASVFGDCEL